MIKIELTSKNPLPKIASIGKGLYITLEPYIFTIKVNDVVKKYTVPKGFILDLLSSKIDLKSSYSCLPITNYILLSINKIYNRAIDLLIPAKGKYDLAALEHDYLYYIQEDRELADTLFYLRLLFLGKPNLVAYDYYAVLRIFGGTAYDNNVSSKNKRVANNENMEDLWYQGKKIQLPNKIKGYFL